MRRVSWLLVACVLPIIAWLGWPIVAARLTKTAEAGKSGMQMDDQRRLRAFEVVVREFQIGDNIDHAVERIEKSAFEAGGVAGARNLLNQRLDSVLLSSGLGQGLINATDRAVIMSLPSDPLFEANSARLSPGARNVMRDIASGIEQFGDDFDVEVTGHTSSNDWILSASQAAAVVTELVNRGVRVNSIEARGLGDTRPLFPLRRPDGAFDKENARRNRRIEIALKVTKRKAG